MRRKKMEVTVVDVVVGVCDRRRRWPEVGWPVWDWPEVGGAAAGVVEVMVAPDLGGERD